VRLRESYSRTYAGSRRAAQELGSDVRAVQEAHLLLQTHGQTLCKRSQPRCDLCPLAEGCRHAGGRP
jgi:endonuclease III